MHSFPRRRIKGEDRDGRTQRVHRKNGGKPRSAGARSGEARAWRYFSIHHHRVSCPRGSLLVRQTLEVDRYPMAYFTTTEGTQLFLLPRCLVKYPPRSSTLVEKYVCIHTILGPTPLTQNVVSSHCKPGLLRPVGRSLLQTLILRATNDDGRKARGRCRRRTAGRRERERSGGGGAWNMT